MEKPCLNYNLILQKSLPSPKKESRKISWEKENCKTNFPPTRRGGREKSRKILFPRKNSFHHFYQQARGCREKKGSNRMMSQKKWIYCLVIASRKKAVEMLIAAWRVGWGKEVSKRRFDYSITSIIMITNHPFVVPTIKIFLGHPQCPGNWIKINQLTSSTSSYKSKIVELGDLILHHRRTVSQLRAVVLVVSSSHSHHCPVVYIT